MRESRIAARRDVWALARFSHHNQLPGYKEKKVLARCQLRLVVPISHLATKGGDLEWAKAQPDGAAAERKVAFGFLEEVRQVPAS